MNPVTFKRAVSDSMKANASADQIRDAMRGYYNSVGYNTIVTKIMYDENDAETSD
jgi:hypothetical protein